LWGPYEKTGIRLNNEDFTSQDLDNIEERLEQITENSSNMIHPFGKPIEKYYSELMSQKYENIRLKFGIITQLHLAVSHPAFLRELHKRKIRIRNLTLKRRPLS
jgi:hypothetical protein